MGYSLGILKPRMAQNERTEQLFIDKEKDLIEWRHKIKRLDCTNLYFGASPVAEFGGEYTGGRITRRTTMKSGVADDELHAAIQSWE